MHDLSLLLKLQLALATHGDRLLYFYGGWLLALAVISYFDSSLLLLGVTVLFTNIYLLMVIKKDLVLVRSHFYEVLGIPAIKRHFSKQLYLVILVLPQLLVLSTMNNQNTSLAEVSKSVLSLIPTVIATLPLHRIQSDNIKIFAFLLSYTGVRLLLNQIF